MRTLHKFGTSVYVSTFERHRRSAGLIPSGTAVFTSLHMQEEVEEGYRADVYRMMQALRAQDLFVIADVSPKTFSFFGTRDIVGFARDMGIDCLRLDYGFTTEEMAAIASSFPVALNASTVDAKGVDKVLQASAHELYAVHNFYPRPETGLDEDYLRLTTRRLQEKGIKVFAFIPGDVEKRGPIFEGLPTLEAHRSVLPYVASMELLNLYALDGVFIGDTWVSKTQLSLIAAFLEDGVINLPCSLYGRDELYDRVFTVRADSPSAMMRLAESREYSCSGSGTVEANNTAARGRGSVTVDNLLYSRYCGEIQIVRKSLPADRRVNVIGNIDGRYASLLECVKNGKRVRLVRNW